VYGLAVAAFERYLAIDTTGRNGQAYDFMARSYNAMEMYHEAISAWDRVVSDFPECPCWGDAWLRRATAQEALGGWASARSGLLTFVNAYPQHPLAAEALTRAAYILEKNSDYPQAAEAYRGVQARYPSSKQGAPALFAAGMCMYRQQQWEEAGADWRRLLEAYPSSDLKDASQLWLGKALLQAGQREQATDAWRALAQKPETYYGQRALAVAQAAKLDLGVAAQRAPSPSPLDQESAEVWLRGRLVDPPAGPLSVFPPALANDPSLVRGQELLKLGLVKQALEELNRVRQRHTEDALALYRLSLLFRELKAYSLSIFCAEGLIRLSPGSTADVPLFVQRLAYPTYYANLVEAEAAERGIDPLLLYALLRQESLFEAEATSYAAARGLMQIIPSTGDWIAGRLTWTDYRTEHLYRPYISIKFGTYYLWAALQMLDGNVAAALAGYNAGPGNAARWLERSTGDDDRFFAEITLAEPRLYIERILAYYATYQRLYGASTPNSRMKQEQ
ncbi:MAG: transglycosylase SLT domain-containing protein, partial [Chloroflexota bacterium]